MAARLAGIVIMAARIERILRMHLTGSALSYSLKPVRSKRKDRIDLGSIKPRSILGVFSFRLDVFLLRDERSL
jgi:hypothetical protein